MPVPQINITLGTAGHIDHGKTALVKLLTGCETDRLKAEKERGISIDLGFAPCRIAGSEVGIVDVPGHENFVRTMVAGASGMDAVMLVVAADDGVMPQTREHLEILKLLGIRHGFVALTKIDRVDAQHREMVQEDTRRFLRGTFLENSPICPISSITGEGFDEYFDALADLISHLNPKPLDGVFRLPVDRAFSARGYGTVVAGIPVSGSARIDEELVLLPEGLLSTIRQIEVYGQSSDVVKAGQCAAINVRHWDAKRIRRGHVVTLPGYFTPQQWFVTRLTLLSDEQIAVKNGMHLKLHTGTSDVAATVFLLEGDRMASGEEKLAQFRTNAPLVAGPGDRFIIRSLSPVRTIGGGVIIEGVEHKLKRNRPGLVEDLRQRDRAMADTRCFIECAVRHAELKAVSEADLAARTKTRPEKLRAILAELVAAGKVLALSPTLFMHPDSEAETTRHVLDVINGFHREAPASLGIDLEELRQRCGIDRTVLDGLLARMKTDGRLREHGGRWAAPDHTAAFQGEDAGHAEMIEELFRNAAFQPPSIQDVCDRVRIQPAKAEKILKTLREHKRLVRVEGAIHFHQEAVDEAQRRIVEHIRREGRLESVQFKYLLDTSRKFAIPLLDYFDRVGVLRREGNTRFLKQ